MANSSDDKRLGIGKTVIFILLLMTVFVSGFVYKINQPRLLSKEDMRANGAIIFSKPRQLSSFNLNHHNGESFNNESLKGKWSLIYPGFTFCPDICPATMSVLKTMWGTLSNNEKSQLQVVMLSVDPQRDSSDVLAQYVTYFSPDFIGIRANLAETYKFATELNIAFTIINPAEQTDNDYSVDHSGNIALINPDGHYHGFFKPPFNPSQLKLVLQTTQTVY